MFITRILVVSKLRVNFPVKSMLQFFIINKFYAILDGKYVF